MYSLADGSPSPEASVPPGDMSNAYIEQDSGSNDCSQVRPPFASGPVFNYAAGYLLYTRFIKLRILSTPFKGANTDAHLSQARSSSMRCLFFYFSQLALFSCPPLPYRSAPMQHFFFLVLLHPTDFIQKSTRASLVVFSPLSQFPYPVPLH